MEIHIISENKENKVVLNSKQISPDNIINNIEQNNIKVISDKQTRPDNHKNDNNNSTNNKNLKSDIKEIITLINNSFEKLKENILEFCPLNNVDNTINIISKETKITYIVNSFNYRFSTFSKLKERNRKFQC